MRQATVVKSKKSILYKSIKSSHSMQMENNTIKTSLCDESVVRVFG